MERVESNNIAHISAPNLDTYFVFNGIEVPLELLKLLKEKMVWKDGRFVIEDLTLGEEQIIEKFIFQ